MSKITAYGISNIGNVRDNHEDNLFVPKNNFIDEQKQKEIRTNKDLVEYEYSGDAGLFAICDGMGGHSAGEVASRIAVKCISSKYDELMKSDKDKLISFVAELNDAICKEGATNINCSNMGTTFSALVLTDDKSYLLQVGDSRIYKFQNGLLSQLSKDHTEGVRLVDAGILKKEDLPKFPNRKLLYKYLGRDGKLVADCEELANLDDSKLIIASDGLSDTLTDAEISEELSKNNLPKDICKALIDKCLAKGDSCTDNVTIICLSIGKI